MKLFKNEVFRFFSLGFAAGAVLVATSFLTSEQALAGPAEPVTAMVETVR